MQTLDLIALKSINPLYVRRCLNVWLLHISYLDPISGVGQVGADEVYVARPGRCRRGADEQAGHPRRLQGESSRVTTSTT